LKIHVECPECKKQFYLEILVYDKPKQVEGDKKE